MWEINCNSYRGQKQNFEKKSKFILEIFKIFIGLKRPQGHPDQEYIWVWGSISGGLGVKR